MTDPPRPPRGPAPGASRRPDIQGLRALAVLAVVAFHAGLPVPGGFVGVDVFFVISGFVITAMLHREWLAEGRIRFRRFYLRRFKRLIPALAVLVSVTVLLSAVVLSPLGTQQTAAKTGIGAMVLLANLVVSRTTGGYFDAPAATNPLLNTWTLSVEEQFYLVFPVLIALAWLAVRRSASIAPRLVVGAVAAGSFVLAVLGSNGTFFRGSDFILGFYSPFTRAWEFAVGALLALAAARLRSVGAATVVGGVGLAAIGASLWLIDASTPFPGVWTLLPVAGSVLLILAGTNEKNLVARALSWRPATAVGDWSYSIYLWHWPVIVFAAILWPDRPVVLVVAAALSFIPAVASFLWIEQPLRRREVRGRGAVARFVGIVLLPPLILGAVLLVASSRGFWSETVRGYQAAILPDHAGQVAGCTTAQPQSQRPPGACTWNATAGGAPIYLVGDSTADHFSEGLIAAATRLDRPLVISTTNACPFAYPAFVSPASSPREVEQCTAYVEGTLQYLQDAPPGLVIISSSDGYWVDLPLAVGELSTGLEDTVSALEKAGQQVMLVQTAPRWTGEYAWTPAGCTMISVLADECASTMPIEHARSVQGPVRAVLADVAASTGAYLMDTWPLLCPDGTCRSQVPGLIRYRDPTHLTVEQSRALADAFTAAIAAAGRP